MGYAKIAWFHNRLYLNKYYVQLSRFGIFGECFQSSNMVNFICSGKYI
jgi:hypothetical protein